MFVIKSSDSFIVKLDYLLIQLITECQIAFQPHSSSLNSFQFAAIAEVIFTSEFGLWFRGASGKKNLPPRHSTFHFLLSTF